MATQPFRKCWDRPRPSTAPRSPHDIQCRVEDCCKGKRIHFSKDHSDKERRQGRSVCTATQASFSVLYFCLFL